VASLAASLLFVPLTFALCVAWCSDTNLHLGIIEYTISSVLSFTLIAFPAALWGALLASALAILIRWRGRIHNLIGGFVGMITGGLAGIVTYLITINTMYAILDFSYPQALAVLILSLICGLLVGLLLTVAGDQEFSG
jgi:hypothetical protein